MCWEVGWGAMGPMIPAMVPHHNLTEELHHYLTVSQELHLRNHKDCIGQATSLSPPRGKT